MVRTAQGEARPLSVEATPCTLDKTLIGRIKQKFDAETKSGCERDCKTAYTTQTDWDNEHKVRHQLRHLERRCAKLKRKLQEKETQIQALQEQQHSSFPLLMHETIRSLHSMDSKNANKKGHELLQPVSHSLIRNMAHEQSNVDARIHEYELQIAELYEENNQERLKSEMLKECLCELKRGKAKLMKACKHAKQELQAARDSGLSQMLMDIEVRCDSVEKEKAHVMDELLAERSLRTKQELKLKAVTEQLEKLRLESTKWEDTVAKNEEKLKQSRDQICDQQLTIENLKADAKKTERRYSRSPEPCQDGKQEEIEQLDSIISVLRAKVREAEQELHQVNTEVIYWRDQVTSQNEKRLSQSEEFSCTARDVNQKLLIQVRFISKRLRALIELVQVYHETSAVDINLLNEQHFFGKVHCTDDSLVNEVDVTQLSCSVMEAARYVAELQQTVEDACARLMGSTCAMQ